MITIDTIKTGKRIEQLRKQVGISVSQLQKMFGFSTPNAIYKWQRGVSMPTVDNFVILASIFATTIDDIIVIKEE